MKAPGPWLAAASLACGGALGVLLGIAMVPTGIQIVAEDPRLREAPGWLGLALGAAEGVWLAGTGVEVVAGGPSTPGVARHPRPAVLEQQGARVATRQQAQDQGSSLRSGEAPGPNL